MKAAQEPTILIENPLAGEELLVDAMYGSPRQAPRRPHAVITRPSQPKPSHYKIVSISLYNEDIERLDRMVAELKKRGHYKANKSQLIRYALAQLDVAKMPKDALDP
ncbi:MAG: ribbon-helix-helix domain-containing protein [Myxococcota bacterium]